MIWHLYKRAESLLLREHGDHCEYLESTYSLLH